MPIAEQTVGEYRVLAPEGRLVMTGPAEELEERLQELLGGGVLHLVADLRRVTQIDSVGVRALVRAYTTAQRVNGSLKLVGPTRLVRAVLATTRLDHVFPIYDSVEAATQPSQARAGG